ncbi:MAG: SDR family NAD(P)-dependent oxidoreductase, partial [Actinobacteria bacterium]|nr:SDR family NAD(P)-dependent oxidoreductase [Actinomycetota bacterium]
MDDSRLALVTGASSGIGAATARALDDAGISVIAAARRVDRLEALASERPRITPWELDVTDQASIDRLAGHLDGRALDVLVANAGGAYDAEPIATADVESWQRAYEVNVIGALRTIKAFLPNLEASGHGLVV